jgi:hypothetical protein
MEEFFGTLFLMSLSLCGGGKLSDVISAILKKNAKFASERLVLFNISDAKSAKNRKSADMTSEC